MGFLPTSLFRRRIRMPFDLRLKLTQVPTKEEKHDFRVKEKNDWATLKSIFFPLPTSYESFGGEKKELKPGVIKPTRSDFFILSSVMLYHYLILTIVN